MATDTYFHRTESDTFSQMLTAAMHACVSCLRPHRVLIDNRPTPSNGESRIGRKSSKIRKPDVDLIDRAFEESPTIRTPAAVDQGVF